MELGSHDVNDDYVCQCYYTSMGNYRRFTKEELQEAAKNAIGIASCLRNLGRVPAGGNYIHLKKRLQKFDIDTSHWRGQTWSKDQQLKQFVDYAKVSSIKKHLLTIRGHKCERCTNISWLDEKIPLEVHHIDGDRTNNEESNLKLLCLNCHGLTKNWRNKKR